jgi:hypothetical protein
MTVTPWKVAFLSVSVSLTACFEPGDGPGDMSTLDGGTRDGNVATIDSSIPRFDGGSLPMLGDGVRVHLDTIIPPVTTVSFAVPLPSGVVSSIGAIRVRKDGSAIAGANVRAILLDYDANGAPNGVRSVLVQFPASALGGASGEVDVMWDSMGTAPGQATVPFRSNGVSADSAETIRVADRTIQNSGGTYSLVESSVTNRTLYTGREPRMLATFPTGFIATSGFVGPVRNAESVRAGRTSGLVFLADAITGFSDSAMYDDGYAVDNRSVVDPITNFEGWLYDRCATFLIAYASSEDSRYLRHGMRACTWYAGKITRSGATEGIFTGKPDPDTKYSHLRGLYAYYALTGDEDALAAGTAIAELWRKDTLFVGPYRQGHLRGVDKLWTERLLGTSFEGLQYGHMLTGDVRYLQAMKEMVNTAYRHITGDAAALAEINPGVNFPPQNCFIHSALQGAEGDGDEPWCSGWMSELVVDPLLRHQAQTGDDRIDEIFVRLTRFLRDVGTNYMRSDPIGDSFLAPDTCYDDGVRWLVPLYGGGTFANGTRAVYGEYEDFEHCADSLAMTSAAIRALVRQGSFDTNPIGPFESEGASFVALHNEFAHCASEAFSYHLRPNRQPSEWSSSELAAGASSPSSFIESNKIGWPWHNVAPQRKLSWWFNSSMLQYGLLDEAGVAFDTIEAGAVQPASCQ